MAQGAVNLGGAAADMKDVFDALAKKLDKTGGEMTGYLDFKQTSTGLRWTLANGDRYDLRPWSPNSIFQLTRTTPDGKTPEYGVLNIDENGNIQFCTPNGGSPTPVLTISDDGIHANLHGTADAANAVAWDNVSGKPSSYPPSGHTHDDRYYTETEVNSLLNGKSNANHNHDDRYLAANGKAASAGYADSAGSAGYASGAGNVNGFTFAVQNTDPGVGSALATHKRLFVSQSGGAQMARAIHPGIDGTARKLKRPYVGVNGVARKVKKAYIGVNGQARLCYSAELEYYNTATDLNGARRGLAAATVGGYALFAGGEDNNNSAVTTVEAYDRNLTRTLPAAMQYAKSYLAAATVGGYALFGGETSDSKRLATVDAYNAALTQVQAPDLTYDSYTDRYHLAAATVGGYALFAGGGRRSEYQTKNDSCGLVDAYNASLTRTTASRLSQERKKLAATTVGNYALFGGGIETYRDSDDSSNHTQPYNTVDVYNSALTKMTNLNLSTDMYDNAAAYVGDYAIFVSGSYTKKASCFNSSLTRTLVEGLTYGNDKPTGVSAEEYALFSERDQTNIDSTTWHTVTAYNASLTKTIVAAKGTKAVKNGAGTYLDGYALFGGGTDVYSNAASSAVYVYSV